MLFRKLYKKGTLIQINIVRVIYAIVFILLCHSTLICGIQWFNCFHSGLTSVQQCQHWHHVHYARGAVLFLEQTRSVIVSRDILE